MDTATNLYYFNARYYDPTIGRFINVDPLQDGNNWYIYCSNNPLCFVDPTGLVKTKQILSGIFQLAVGVAEITAVSVVGTAAAVGTAGVASPGAVALMAIGTIDGLKNITDGLTKIVAGANDQDYAGMIPEIVGGIAKANGASDEQLQTVKDTASLIEGAATLPLPTNPNKLGPILYAADALLTNDTVQDTGKNIVNVVDEVLGSDRQIEVGADGDMGSDAIEIEIPKPEIKDE